MTNNLLLINDRSGAVSAIGVKRCIQELSQFINGSIDIEVASGDPAQLIRAARTAVTSEQVDHIYLAGGDGTCAAIADILSGSEVTLAALPGGTMNAFAQDLGFDGDLLTAITQIPGAKARYIDIAYASGFAFLNNVVFGAYTAVAESREHLRNAAGIGEFLDSAAEIAGTIAHAGNEQYKVTIDGFAQRVQTNTIMVANNIYDGAENLRPTRTYLDKGLLGCYVAESTTGADFLSVIINALTGNIADSEQISVRECRNCRVESDSGILAISIDGEAKELPSPVNVCVKPNALRVLAPTSTPQSD